MRVLQRRFTTVIAAGVVGVAAVSGGGEAQASAIISPGDMVRLALVEYGCTVGFTGHSFDGAPLAVTAGAGSRPL